jgi:hypothetical protein
VLLIVIGLFAGIVEYEHEHEYDEERTPAWTRPNFMLP